MVDTNAHAQRALDDPGMVAPVVDITVPIYNEVAELDDSIRRLHAYLGSRFPFSWRITIVDNASTDSSWFAALSLARELDRVRAVRLGRKGRGLALRTAWMHSDAAVVAYMDVDLSTDLNALLPLVAPLVSGHSDIAIGSRLAAGASVARRPKREVISRCYNVLLRTVFATRVRDAQCGFKAMRAEVGRALLPHVDDDGWFFDTELLLLAEHNGLRIHEVPVDWIDDDDSRVHITRTALGDLRGSARVARSFLRGRGRVELGDLARRRVDDDRGRRIVSFASIGAASTAISLVLFLLWRHPLGAVGANAAAVTATFLANTWLHTRITARIPRPRWRAATAVYLGSLALTSSALFATHTLMLQLLVLAITWMMAALARVAVLERSSR